MAVRSFKAGNYWDDLTPGFGIRVGKRTKTWTIIRGLDRERITIGRYPDLSLSQARTEAKKLLSIAPEVKAPKLTFGAAKDHFLNENYRDASIRTFNEAKRLLTRHFSPLFPRDLSSIEDGDIKKRLDTLKATPSEQLHAYRVVRCFFRWCTRPPRRFIKHSPMDGYEPPAKDRKGTRVLTDQELKAVWEASGGPTTQFIRLLILWGTRPGETSATAKIWSSGGILTIPGTHTKNGRDHSVPILPLAQEVLNNCPDGPHYFPSRWGDDHLSSGAWNKIKTEVQAKSHTTNWQLRDLRRTFRSGLARLKVSRDLAEVLINHAPPVLDEIYDRYDRLDEKREALAKWENHLQKLLGIG